MPASMPYSCLGSLGVGQRIVDRDRIAEAFSSRTMSTTRVLRMSGTFSLNVRPRTQHARSRTGSCAASSSFDELRRAT